jgi:hypothetical protein
MLLQDLGGPARPMTNAAEQLNLALVELAIQVNAPAAATRSTTRYGPATTGGARDNLVGVSPV